MCSIEGEMLLSKLHNGILVKVRRSREITAKIQPLGCCVSVLMLGLPVRCTGTPCDYPALGFASLVVCFTCAAVGTAPPMPGILS